jgi:putative endonuclease
MWCVYLLRCADGTLYTGITNDLPRRLAAHHSGRGARYTRGRGPLALVHTEPARTRSAALRREHQLKRLRRRDKLAFLDTLPGHGYVAAMRRTAESRSRQSPE